MPLQITAAFFPQAMPPLCEHAQSGLSATLWTVARQAPLSKEFFRQEYGRGLPFPLQENLPHPGFKPESPVSLALQVDSLPTEPLGKTLVSIQFGSVAQSCPTLYDPMDCSMPGLPLHHQLPEFIQTHVH